MSEKKKYLLDVVRHLRQELKAGSARRHKVEQWKKVISQHRDQSPVPGHDAPTAAKVYKNAKIDLIG